MTLWLVPAVLWLAGLPATATAKEGQRQIPLPSLAPHLRSLAAKATLESLERPGFSRYRDSVRHFYERRDYAPAWLEGSLPTAQAKIIVAVLERARSKGLDERDYDAGVWERRLQALVSGSVAAQADFDLALTVCVLRYASDLEFGRVPERAYRSGLKHHRVPYSVADWMGASLIHASDTAAAFTGLEPPYAAYRRTGQALEQYQRLAALLPPGGARIPAVRKGVKPGDAWTEVGRVADFLRSVGDLPPEAVVDASQYAEPLVTAVKRFQTRHGLAADGAIGRETIAAMNVPMRRRLRQIELTLERWRWVPHSFQAPPVVVNVPEFELRAVGDNYRVGLRMKVVVGGAYGHRTPVFAREMTHLIFRPYWEVPHSIARKELLPKLAKDPDYFTKNHYVIVAAGNRALAHQTEDPAVLEGVASGLYRVRQEPGPDNALDGVKFMFPNEHNVYLHGTPATELFSKTRRDFSHGCIRVEKPAELAQWVLRSQPEWTRERIAEAMNRDTPLQLKLDRPIPVLIVYGTAVAPESGEVHFYNDIYRLDAALDRALAARQP